MYSSFSHRCWRSRLSSGCDGVLMRRDSRAGWQRRPGQQEKAYNPQAHSTRRSKRWRAASGTFPPFTEEAGWVPATWLLSKANWAVHLTVTLALWGDKLVVGASLRSRIKWKHRKTMVLVLREHFAKTVGPQPDAIVSARLARARDLAVRIAVFGAGTPYLMFLELRSRTCSAIASYRRRSSTGGFPLLSILWYDREGGRGNACFFLCICFSARFYMNSFCWWALPLRWPNHVAV